MGYRVKRIGESERILPTAISQKFTTRADGELVPLTEGSTRPVTMHTTHAGIATVEQFDLRMPWLLLAAYASRIADVDFRR
jgi:hypothetical protein